MAKILIVDDEPRIVTSSVSICNMPVSPARKPVTVPLPSVR